MNVNSIPLLWSIPYQTHVVSQGNTRQMLYSTVYIMPSRTLVSWVFHFAKFVNFQRFAKIFQQKVLTCGVQCARAANLRNYFNKIFKNRYSQKFRPSKI